MATNSALVNYITKLRIPKQFYNFTSAVLPTMEICSILFDFDIFFKSSFTIFFKSSTSWYKILWPS